MSLSGIGKQRPLCTGQLVEPESPGPQRRFRRTVLRYKAVVRTCTSLRLVIIRGAQLFLHFFSRRVECRTILALSSATNARALKPDTCEQFLAGMMIRAFGLAYTCCFKSEFRIDTNSQIRHEREPGEWL